MGLTSETFEELMRSTFDRIFGDARDDAFNNANAYAVAVSGGADSMALLFLLQEWCAAHDKVLHVLSVDHCLRAEALQECHAVGEYCEQFEHVFHDVLTWDVPSEARVQEEARKARYDMMARYCMRHGIQHFLLGLHALLLQKFDQ